MIKCFDPSIGEEEAQFVLRTLQSKQIGFGDEVKRFENAFKKLSGYHHNVGFNSASSAAYALFAWLSELYGSCEVYTPSLSFCSPAWAAKKNGHEIIFVDVDENGLFSVDDYKTRKKNTSKKKVVMPMMYGGVANFPFNTFNDGEVIISDSAHAIHSPSSRTCTLAGLQTKIRPDYCLFSFHPVKPICMSNGGMLSCINRSAYRYFLKYRNFGREVRGVSYDITQDGFNFYMNSLNASIGLAQLNKVYEMAHQRGRNHDYLKQALTALKIPNFHMFKHDQLSSFYLCTFTSDSFSGDIIMSLRDLGIEATYHYPPLHKTTAFRADCELPNTEYLSKHLVNIPIHQNLTPVELDQIVQALSDLEL